jgi:hypothetical protein
VLGRFCRLPIITPHSLRSAPRSSFPRPVSVQRAGQLEAYDAAAGRPAPRPAAFPQLAHPFHKPRARIRATSWHFRAPWSPLMLSLMFRRTRDRLDRIERVLEQLAARLDTPAPAPTAGPFDALANLLGGAMKNNVDLVSAMGELAVKSVARRNGIRGGNRNIQTAQRDGRGQFLPKRTRLDARPRCPLCKDPSYRDVTISMITEHRRHTADDSIAAQGREEHEHIHEPNQSDQGDGSGSYRNGSPPDAGVE